MQPMPLAQRPASMFALYRGLTRPAVPQASLTHRYDTAAQGWHRKLEHLGYVDAYQALSDHARQRMAWGTAPRLRVLDAGAGTGAFSIALATRAQAPLRLDLVDPSASMLAHASQNLDRLDLTYRARVGRLDELPDAVARYDVVLCGHLVEHLDDPLAGLSQLRRMLRPGGLLLLVANKPHWCTRLLRLRWGHRAFAPGWMVGCLEAAGFASVEQFAFAKGPPSRTSRGYLAVA